MKEGWFRRFTAWLSGTADSPRPAMPPPIRETLGNFTPRAQQALALARKEADRFHHNFVGTEHLLLGLIRLGQGTAVSVLGNLGLKLDDVRKAVEEQVGGGPEQNVTGNIPYTPRVKKVLALAAREAQALRHTYIGTEHMLLGLLREGDGVAARVLLNLGIDLEKTRNEILRELNPDNDMNAKDPRQFDRSKFGDFTTTGLPTVDITKRYDVYCSEMGARIVVYRNVRFMGVRGLLCTEQFDVTGRFFEVEQPNGQCIFVSKHSLIKFCESGVEPLFDVVAQK